MTTCAAGILLAAPGTAPARAVQAALVPVVLSEIMVNPTGLGRAREYVELYNRSAETIDLGGWTLGDTLDLDLLVPVSSGLLLPPGQYALVLDPDYFEVDEPYGDIPPEALIVSIEDKTFGRYGLTNDATKTVILSSPEGAIQSVTYLPDDIVKGYSLEKIDFDRTDSRTNWARCLLPEGTPGRPNSRGILDYDVALTALVASPDTIHPPATVSVYAQVANVGRNTIGDGHVVLFADSDGDSLFSVGEAVLAETNLPPLARGEDVAITFPWDVVRPLEFPLRAAVLTEMEERSADNVLPLSVVVGMPAGVLRITEVMAAPGLGEGQWVEIGNVGEMGVSLVGCRLVAGRSSTLIIAPTQILAPGDLLVVAEYPDSLQLRYGFVVLTASREGAFPHLSTTASAQRSVWLDDATGRTIDRATYPVPEPGRSLELAGADRSGEDLTAWVAVWGPHTATPGMPNQAAMPLPDAATLLVGPSPPTDTVGIAIDLPESTVFLTIRIYDPLGREVRRLADGERWPARVHIRWDGQDSRGAPTPTGPYVLFVEGTGVESGKSYRLVRSVVIVRRR